MNDTHPEPLAEDTAQAAPHRRIRSFVLRAGRMTESQRRAWERLWPVYGRELEQGALDASAVFARQAPLTLEIGFGMGTSLAAMAAASPEQDFVGIEVHRPGVGALLKLADEAGLNNLRVYCTDANDVLDQCIADASLDRVLLFFPDPWHKSRHHKRRLVQPAFVQRIRQKLRVGGVFHMATDWENYAEHMMDVMSAAEGFANQAGDGCYAPRPDDRPVTKFEKRGERLGHGVWDLLFVRTA